MDDDDHNFDVPKKIQKKPKKLVLLKWTKKFCWTHFHYGYVICQGVALPMAGKVQRKVCISQNGTVPLKRLHTKLQVPLRQATLEQWTVLHQEVVPVAHCEK